MRLGVVSAILGSMDFFEAVDCVSSLGYTCMEAACWPGEKADRRYAGVQHINVRALDKAAAKRISSYCTDRSQFRRWHFIPIRWATGRNW